MNEGNNKCTNGFEYRSGEYRIIHDDTGIWRVHDPLPPEEGFIYAGTLEIEDERKDAVKETYKEVDIPNAIKDKVIAPHHYANRKYQTILVIQDSMSLEEFKGYCRGNILKYISRAGLKDNVVQDLKKAQTYLQWLVELEENGELIDVPSYCDNKGDNDGGRDDGTASDESE